MNAAERFGDGDDHRPQCTERGLQGWTRQTHPVSDNEGALGGLFAGVPYEYTSVVGGGSMVFTSGACPLDDTGGVVAPGDFVGQAEQCMDNLRRALALAGASFEHIVRMTIYVAGDRDDLAAVWEATHRHVSRHRPPSTLLGVRALGYPNQLVEIDAVAALPPATDAHLAFRGR